MLFNAPVVAPVVVCFLTLECVLRMWSLFSECGSVFYESDEFVSSLYTFFSQTPNVAMSVLHQPSIQSTR